MSYMHYKAAQCRNLWDGTCFCVKFISLDKNQVAPKLKP